MTPSDQAEAERRYPFPHNPYSAGLEAERICERAAYIAGREDERAALAGTVPVSRAWLRYVEQMIVERIGTERDRAAIAAEIKCLLEGEEP